MAATSIDATGQAAGDAKAAAMTALTDLLDAPDNATAGAILTQQGVLDNIAGVISAEKSAYDSTAQA